MTPVRMSAIEGEIRIVLEFKEAFNRQDVPAMLALLSDEVVFETLEGTLLSGKPAVAEYWQDYFQRWPQAQLTGEDTFTAFGRRIVLRWKRSQAGQSEAGEALRGVDIFRVMNGRITEQLAYAKGPLSLEDNQ